MDVEKIKHSLQKQLNAGATSLTLLALLHRQQRPMYGYEVAKELEGRCNGELPMKPGALYPVLRSLEKQGLLASHLEPSDAGPPRKYYRVTKAGAAVLKHWSAAWRTMKNLVDSVVEEEHVSRTRESDSALPKRAPSGSEGGRQANRGGRAKRRAGVT